MFRKKTARPIIVFLLLTFLSYIEAFAQQTQPGVITGKVRDQKGGGIPSVSVTAFLKDITLAVVTTDKVGNFSIPITKSGKYSFEFSAKGYVTQQKGPYEVKAENGLSILVDMEQSKIVPPTDTTGVGQGIVIKGIVLSSKDNAPIEGVTVSADGKQRTSTTAEGEYKITLSANTRAILFSHVNYESIELPVKPDNLNDFRVINLVEVNKDLGEVTVVAFGTQKKESVVASIATITPADLRRPTSNLTTSLAGQVAGIIAYQRSGEPGRDNAEFFIRGITSFGTSGMRTPLILIDGVAMETRDLAVLQPDDIASFSVMKDASAAALYGARGANGVILVTTKKGVEGKPTLSFRAENSFSLPLGKIEIADPLTYMELHNEAIRTRDPLDPLPYTQSQIDNLRFETNPYVFPAINWREMMIKPYTQNQRYNFNLNGGGKTARYYVAGTYNLDNGILKVDKLNDFNSNVKAKVIQVRSNVDINVTKSTQIGIKMFGTFDEYTGPIQGGAAVFQQTLRANPVLFPPTYSADSLHRFTKHVLFGNAPRGNYLNPYAEMVKGYQNSSRTNLLAQFEAYQDLNSITPGLKARALLNTTRTSFFALNRSYVPYYYIVSQYDRPTDTYSLQNINPEQGQEFLSFNQGDKTISTAFYLESAVNYDKVFNDKHNLAAMMVYYMRSTSNANAGSLLLSLPNRNLGLSGRIAYNYDRRYFVEWNFGYNGSERFDVKNRFGFFPSFGLAWIPTNEKFMKDISFVKTLKFRGTYGFNGNDAIGDANDRFFYLSNVTLTGNAGPGFGLDFNFPLIRPTTTIQRYANPFITWERAKKLNLGFDLTLVNNLTMTVDMFREDRSNILMDRASITEEMGLEATVRANVGKAYTKGWEASLNYQHHFNEDLSVGTRGNFTYAVGRYKVYEEPEYVDAPWLSHPGQPITQTWGYVAERLFIDQQDIDNSPEQTFGGEYLPGDIKYADINNDGIINFKDQVPIGFPTSPEIIYGFGFNSVYKQFDLGVFFQGSARSSFWIDRQATSPFINYGDNGGLIANNALLSVYQNSHWSEANQDIYATWPRLSGALVPNNNQTSTWFMRNGTFLRLKNAELGYTLPASVLHRFYIASCRIYANGNNLLTFSKFRLWDPEMAGNGLGYPVQRVYNIGLQLSFR